MQDFSGKTVFITGGSRGIGKAIALKLARQGANIAIGAKTTEPHPKLEGTIFSAVTEINNAGGHGLALEVDVRNEEMVQSAIDKTVETFGGIDILINNASAINISDTEALPMKAFDLMQQVNSRGTFMVSQKCIPHLKKSANPHILTLSPPINLNPKWFAGHLAYTISKYTMSMCVLGLSAEFKKDGIAANALWPKTLIATAAVRNLLGGEQIVQKSRHPEIVAEAAYHILKRDSKTCTGNFFIDEEVLKAEGKTDFSEYDVVPGAGLMTDLFL